jgi:hypothetical protein
LNIDKWIREMAGDRLDECPSLAAITTEHAGLSKVLQRFDVRSMRGDHEEKFRRCLSVLIAVCDERREAIVFFVLTLKKMN